MKVKEIKEVLKNWSSLNAAMVDMSLDDDYINSEGKEKVLEKLLAYELKHGKRETFIVRIHGKLVRVRAARERLEYLELIK